MKLLQILVWILLFMVSYDLVTYFLAQRSEGQPAAGEGGGQWNSIFGYDGTDFAPFFHWLVGGSCLLALYVLRLIFKRFVPTPTNNIAEQCLPKNKLETPQPKKRESFLTCRISDSTINTYTDDQNYDIPDQLSTAQLQVLLEELKFSVDEKFEEIDAWIVANEHELKLWLKRLERVETELSYIRHQIFILMSSNAKVGSNLCIGDVPDSRDHVETLRDLSTILAQVKKQFHEDESKGKKVREYGDHGTNYSTPKTIVLKEVNEVDRNNTGVVELRGIDPEQRFMILKELNVKKCNKKYDELPKKEDIEKDEVTKPIQIEHLNKPESVESDVVSLSSDNREDSNSTYHSEKDGFPSSYDNHGPSIYEKWEDREDPNRIEVLKTEQPRNEECIRKSRTPSPPSPPRREDAGGDRPTSQKNSSPDRKIKVKVNQENYLPNAKVIDESSTSTNVIIMNDTIQQDSLNETSHPNKENLTRSPSPKRTVRFAQDKREVSPSKAPTWLAIKREPSPIKANYIKGGSDSKVTSASYSEGVKGNRDSASCPIVEDKRPSRRTILEKELTNLERRVSPSPPRQRQSRRSNVRSKVADYIRGAKN